MDLLDNPVHRDPWGSPTAIPRLLGEEPDGRPYSELWVGAHPASSSRLERDGTVRSLADVIVADPDAELGRAIAEAYGARLPFLVKVLAAAKPLSLQAHPDLARAAAGFADEERRGVARDDPARTYVDPNHKPEMLCALTEFHALCGFRPAADTVAMMEALDVAPLASDLAVLSTYPGERGIRTVLTRWLHLPIAERGPFVQAVAARCAALAVGAGRDAELAATVLELAALYPGDVGAVCALLMNQVTLQAGEAVYLAPGILHAYLRGTGVEVMASSDNVLRAGLTVRHVAVDALLDILDTRPGAVPLVPRIQESDVETSYPAPVPDFVLAKIALGPSQSYELAAGLPRVLLVVEGGIEVDQAGQVRAINCGQAAFMAADDPPAELTGAGIAFLATTSAAGRRRESRADAAG